MCRLVVGAPRHQTEERGIERAGAIFRCKVDSVDCQRIPFERSFDYNGRSLLQCEKFAVALWPCNIGDRFLDGTTIY